MAYEEDIFTFPDELEEEKLNKVAAEEFDIEVEDDTPTQDRNKQPLPKETIEELEKDDLSDYSDKVKTRISQMKKVWHDERRAKEAAFREQQEAVALASRVLEENKRLKATLTEGEKHFVSSVQNAAELELEMAKKQYREAIDTGDADIMLEAQQKLSQANIKVDKAQNFKPALQNYENDVQSDKQVAEYQQQPKIDATTAAWLDKNKWYGDPNHEDMSGLAMIEHNRLAKTYGASFVGSPEYFQRIDETMRKRFPEEFQDAQNSSNENNTRRTESKSASIVAPATRSTASKKIVLKASQVALAKKLGLTAEQYARELQKMEA
jgi:hypothetical protein